MATKDDIASIIIRSPQDAKIAVTHNGYDIILLPQATGVEDGARVITVYNGRWDLAHEAGYDLGGDSLDSYALCTSKEDAYIAIGGNYVDNFDAYVLVTAKKAPFDSLLHAPDDGALVLYDEDGNPVKSDFTYVVDANYNVHHMAFSATGSKNQGAVRFSGDTGHLHLVAQSGAKNSADYDQSKYAKYYNITLDLSEFEKVQAGSIFYYSVDGSEFKSIVISDPEKVTIDGDDRINEYAKVEWYVSDGRNEVTDRYFINDLTEDGVADVQEYSAEYRKNQLRIDVTDYIEKMDECASYKFKYTYESANGIEAREVALTQENGRYIFVFDNAAENSVLSYQIVGLNNSGAKIKYSEEYKTEIADGKLVADESDISVQIRDSDTIIVDLSAYFKEKVTDFDRDGVSYTFGGAEVRRDAEGCYVAEISNVEDKEEYKLVRKSTYWSSSNEPGGITKQEITAEIITGYIFDEASNSFLSPRYTVEETRDGEGKLVGYKIDITNHLNGNESYGITPVRKDASLGLPMLNTITYQLRTAGGDVITRSTTILTKYDATDERWEVLGAAADAGDSICFELDNLPDGAALSGFDIEFSVLGSRYMSSYYTNQSIKNGRTFKDDLSICLGITSDGYEDNEWVHNSNYTSGGNYRNYHTIKDVLTNDSSCIGFVVSIKYEAVVGQDAEGKDIIATVTKDFPCAGFTSGASLNETWLADKYEEIVKELGLRTSTTDESGNTTSSIDESKIKGYSVYLYDTTVGGNEINGVDSLHYGKNEIPAVTEYIEKGIAIFDFTDYILKKGGSLNDTYKVSFDGNGEEYDLASDDGRFVVKMADQIEGNDHTFKLTDASGKDFGQGAIKDIGQSNFTDIAADFCESQIVVDINSYIKEFKAQCKEKGVDVSNFTFNVYIDGQAYNEAGFTVNDDATIKIDVINPDETKSVKVVVEQDNVERSSENAVVNVLKSSEGDFIYNISSAVNRFLEKYSDKDSVTYQLMQVDAENPSKDKVLATCYGSEELRDWMSWVDANSILQGDVVELYIRRIENPEEAENAEKSDAMRFDRRSYIESDGTLNLSAWLEDLSQSDWVTDENRDNIKYLVKNITSGLQLYVSGDKINETLPDMGKVGDVIRISIVEDNIIEQSGDVWQISGNDTAIVNIKTALQTQNIKKTDDKIALRSDNYGIYGGDFSRGDSDRQQHVTKLRTWEAPGDTLNYTILADNNLVVESDLAGRIETNTNALHFGYHWDVDDKGRPITRDDAAGRTISGASVKAQNITLQNNFRADIDTHNNAETMKIAQEYSGESVYDANGVLIADKSFKIGVNKQGVPYDGEYNASTTFLAYNQEDKKWEPVKLEGIKGKPWVYEGDLYYETAEGIKVVENVQTSSNLEWVENYSEGLTFTATEEYVARPHSKYVLQADGSWAQDRSYFEGKSYIKLNAGEDYEVGEYMSNSKDLGRGVFCWSDERQILRTERTPDGGTQTVIYVFDAPDWWNSDVAVNRKSQQITGTWLTAYQHGKNDASGNTLEDIGIAVSGNLTQSTGIWAGNISASTNDSYIGAHAEYLAPSVKDGPQRLADQADASNNTIAAYGVRVDGTMDVKKIDAVSCDDDGVAGAGKQDPYIKAEVSGNEIQAWSENDSDIPDWESVANSTFTAAAIHAGTLNIDTVSSTATFETFVNRNKFTFGDRGVERNTSGSAVKAYGIYAKTATFRDFDGNIYVESLGNEGGEKNVSAGIWVTGTLTGKCNLNGTIVVNSELKSSYGIDAANITVQGALDTDIFMSGSNNYACAIYTGSFKAAGFTGSVNTLGVDGYNMAIAVSSAVGSVSQDAFDIAGSIYTLGYGFSSLQTVNLRVSGEIYSATWAIRGEVKPTEDGEVVNYNATAFKDYVEFSGTAFVVGNIDLGKGINNYSINSNATLHANILDIAGQANIVYHLEGKPAAGHITHYINSYDDQTIYSTNTITLNINYAEVGENYQLIKYDLADAEEYWINREVAVMYQGQTVAFKLDEVVEQQIDDISTSCKAADLETEMVGGIENHKVYIDDVLANANCTFPETSGIQFAINYSFVNTDGKNVTGTTETVFDEYGKRYFYVAGLQGDLSYTISNDGVNHSYYTGSATVKNAAGEEVTITGTFTVDTDIFSVEISGKDGALTPVKPTIDYQKLAEGQEVAKATFMPESGYDEKTDTLTLKWNRQNAADYGLVEIYAYEVEYVVYDQNGDPLGKSIAVRILNGESCAINGIDENMTVDWRIRVLGSSSASMSSGWSEWQSDKSGIRPNDVAQALNLTYDEGNSLLTLSVSQVEGDASYLVEYVIFDENNQTTKAAVTLDKANGYKAELKDIEAGYSVEYHLYRKDDGWTSLVSDAYHVADLAGSMKKDLISFNTDGFSSVVVDANYNERELKGVVGSIANITFTSMESQVEIRNYVIEYCSVTEQVTLEKAQQAGAATVEEYITNNFEDLAGNNEIYTKVFTGTALDLSEIQNQTYVYWRIKAVDVNGYSSEWVAGNTFRVWANAEGDKYAPVFTDPEYTIIGLDYNPAAADNFEQQTQLKGYVGWTKAEDSDSGVKSYVIQFKNDVTGEVITKNIGSENNTPATVSTYDISLDDYQEGDEFTVTIGGKSLTAKISVLKDEVDQNKITGYRLTWENIGEKYTGEVTINKNGSAFRANLNSGENGYSAIVYDYLFDFEGMTGSSYSYTLYALDFFGNKSSSYNGNFSVDSAAPSNLKTRVSTQATDNNVTCTIFWSEAADDNELGIRYYEIRYREKGAGDDAWISIKVVSGDKDYQIDGAEGYNYQWKFDISTSEQVDYEYEVIAHDYFERQTVEKGQFGSRDIVAPSGTLNYDAFKADVSAVYKITQVEQEVTDENGNTTTIVNTVVGDLESAEVVLRWGGSFIDDSELRYKVEVSDDQFFLSDKTYSFWTEGEETSMVFDNATPGRPVGIFEGMQKIYWRVTVADEYFNVAVVGETQSFDFVDEKTGKVISTNKSPATPSNLVIRNTEMEDGVHTGKNIFMSWQSANDLLGVYSYKIELINSDTKKVVAVCDTIDKVAEQETDIKSLFNVSQGTNSSTLSIDSLSELFGQGDKLADGNYTIRITAVDGKGRVSDSCEAQFIQDTTRPVINISSIEERVLPAGNQSAQYVLDWSEAVKNSSKDIDHFVIYYAQPNADNELQWKRVGDATKATSYTVTHGIGAGKYYYKIEAYDKAGNVSSGDLWNDNNILTFDPTIAVDRYSNEFGPEITEMLFDESGRSIMPTADYELVGNGDVDWIKIKTGNSAEMLTLTAENFEIYYGKDTKVKVEIFEANSSTALKSFTVGGEGRIFGELLLKANANYYCRITSVNNSSVAAYKFIWDKCVIGGSENFNKQDDTADKIQDIVQNESIDAAEKEKYTLNIADNGSTSYTDWVGYDDEVDRKLLNLSASGKYDISLSGVDEAAAVTLIERVKNANGSYTEKKVASVNVTQNDLNGKKLSNLLLDANKEYYLEVKIAGKNTNGSSYKVEVTPIETYKQPSLDDDVRSKDLSRELVENKTVTDWVGYGDATDYYLLDVGEYGSVYNVTIKHNVGMETEAVKLVVYEYTGTNSKGVDTYRSVKSVTLAKDIASVSTGSIYLPASSANGGIYYVEVTAAGAGKSLNSDYTLTIDGKQLSEITSADRADDYVENATMFANGTAGWVGVGDTADFLWMDASTLVADKYYTLTLNNTNGVQIKAAIGYEDPKGKFVALQTVTGLANTNNLMLSRKFTAAELDKIAAAGNGNRLIVKIFSNGKTDNSDYVATWTENAVNNDDDKLSTALPGSVEVGKTATGWVGLGDAVDYLAINGVNENGFYCFNLDAEANNLVLKLYDEKFKEVGTANATVAADGKIYWALDKDKQYYVGVSNANASKGLNSDYQVSVEKLDSLADQAGVVVPAGEAEAFSFAPDKAGIYSFALNDIKGGQVKVSIYNAATNKLLEAFTSKAAAKTFTFAYNFAEGDYMIKIEAGDKNGMEKIFDISHNYCSGDSNDVIVGVAKDDSSWTTVAAGENLDGWVGLTDIDFIRLDLDGVTGSYDLNLSGLDNSVVMALLEVSAVNGDGTVKATKSIKNVTGTAAKEGWISNLLLDSSKTYYVQIKASGAKNVSDYTLSLIRNEGYVITVNDDIEFGNETQLLKAGESVDGWVGFGDLKDCFKISTAGYDATNITVALNDFSSTGNLKVEIVDTLGKVVKTLTLSSTATKISTGDLMLAAGDYSIRVTAPKGAAGVNADYTVTVDQYKFDEFQTNNNNTAFATKWEWNKKENATIENAVWLKSDKTGDSVDYYTITVGENEAGTFAFELNGISGNNIKISIGTDNKGAFKSLQSVTGAAGQDELLLVRNLAAGTYLIKVEAAGTGKSSAYEMTVVRNEDRVYESGEGDSKNLFNVNDNTWQQVANDIDAQSYGVSDTIVDWVGLGDAVDVFKINLDDNGVLVLDCNDATKRAVDNKEISISLLDSAGKSIALTYNSLTGEYSSKSVLGSDVDYYLNVKNNNTAKFSTEFGITIK